MTSTGPLHVVTAGDENYAPGILVLAGSVWRHNPGARITVLGLGLSDASAALMRELAAAMGGEIEVLATDRAAVDGLAANLARLSVATFLRIEIPRLLPDVARAIYLDSDMVVMGSLAPLWEMGLGQALIAAVPDPSTKTEEFEALGMQAGEYVNSGLLVMNLDLWRAEAVGEKCRAFLTDPEQQRFQADQSAINAICRHRVVALPARWNFWSRSHSVYDESELAEAPVVVHFVGAQKPWLYSDVPAEALWLAEAAALPVRLPALQRRPLQKARRHALARAEHWLRRHVYAALGIRGYRARKARAKVDAELLRLWEARFIAPHVAATSASGAPPGIHAR